MKIQDMIHWVNINQKEAGLAILVSNNNLRVKAFTGIKQILLIDRRNDPTRSFTYQQTGKVPPGQPESSLSRLLCPGW